MPASPSHPVLRVLKRVLLWLAGALVVFQVAGMLYHALRALYYHQFAPPVDHASRYGPGSWVVITGGSSGQGRCLALEFARRGFNLLLIGSRRSFDVREQAARDYPGVEVRVVLRDFGLAFQPGFFDPVRKALGELPPHNVSVLVNNVGSRSAFDRYEAMPPALIRSTIAAGTVTQAMMTRLVLPYLLDRGGAPYRSALLSVTAQVMHPTFGPGSFLSPALYLPYLSVYEAANWFGYAHANSIEREFAARPEAALDHLIITPGAVLTPNTADFLRRIPGAIEAKDFVANVMRLLGNVRGVWSGSMTQGLSLWLVNLFPPAKDAILVRTARAIRDALMQRDQLRRRVM